MITQCPIQPSNNFTYRFDVVGQEGTLWWHAHVGSLRASIHGALIIRPRSSSYPFPKPDHEIPIVIGEWWEMDLVQLDMRLSNGFLFDMPGAATINGKPGDLYSCAGFIKENNILNVQHGKTYLLRIVNAALDSEYYFKIAEHMLTVVAADANYVKTLDALLIANAPRGGYYMVAKAYQPLKPAIQALLFISRGIVLYDGQGKHEEDDLFDTPVVPNMPDQHDAITSFYFNGNLTSLQPLPLLHQVSTNIDEHLFFTLDAAYFCREGGSSCHNVTHYYNNMSNIGTLRDLPDRALRMFNYNMSLEPTSKATSVRRLWYNTTVEIVFQSPLLADSYSNPMHMHGHDFFILAQGFGKYDAEKDVKRYNLVDLPVRNTVHVPIFGWAVIRFVTKNPDD
ncbi:hypothetical protein BRADI_3g02361v3 [Brachypodium distachyon]|nr:hypothetical protein BRADI_3g02361v3 [Brachypodium distachyon]